MARGSKDKYTDKQKRKAEHIEDSYEDKGLSKDEAESRAWATVNKQSGGGNAGGSGQQKSSKAKRESREGSARRAAASRRGVSRKQSLEEETVAELRRMARAKDIHGRSSMRKAELVKALKKAA
ncbi:MAG: Rho termination factor N-terminal domain-containing protein [Halopseudomonas sp.]|uniref:Rho termination factor N-terminal domain-containing protein n=1 Tax=Halopseudomonas sp. TaxID=2901191 RepID=UPI00300373B6